MANEIHVEVIRRGVHAWNSWRLSNPQTIPDLSGAELNEADLRNADLSDANLSGANLARANLSHALLYRSTLGVKSQGGIEFDFASEAAGADLSNSDLSDASFNEANLRKVNLSGARLDRTLAIGANLERANLRQARLRNANLDRALLWKVDLRQADLQFASLREANLSEGDLTSAVLERADLENAILRRANLQGANLRRARLTSANFADTDLSNADLSEAFMYDTILVRADVDKATFSRCRVHGISAWGLRGNPLDQSDLVITREGEPTITADYLEVAQFMYMVLDGEKLRELINATTSRAVLILGRFTPERVAILDAIRRRLRQYHYVPLMFDFEKADSRDFTETVVLLAHMARFVIADLTEPSSVPKELEAFVPRLSVPVQPLLEGAARPYSMFKDYWKYDWVMDLHRYSGVTDLLDSLYERVIAPAEAKAKQLEKRRQTGT